MNSKQIWTTIGIAAVTAVIVWIILGYAFGGVMFGPIVEKTIGQPAGIVNAHQCTRDSVCEMNSAESDNIRAEDTVSTRYLAILNEEGDGKIASIDGLGNIAGTRGWFSSLGNSVEINPAVENPFRATSYAGDGDAYACISSNGNIFRSQTPCV